MWEWLLTFPFPAIPIYSIPIPSRPIPNFVTHSHSHGIPKCAIPIHTAVQLYITTVHYCYIIIDTVQKSWSFIITVLKNFCIGFRFKFRHMVPLVFVINYAKCKRTPLSVQSLKSVSQQNISGN